ncbi:heparinase II/III family protein [Sphingomonas sp. RS6]
MNALTPDPGADGVEEGKRLVRVGGDRGLSLADRVADRFQRLAWRTPLHAMRLKGRHPLKLIAVADDPFFGDPVRGNALLDGSIRIRGETRPIATLDLAKPDWSPAFGAYLHGFAWLRDLSSVATRAVGVPIAEEITRRWLAIHGEKVADPAWRPDLTGQRILFWTAHAPLVLSSTDQVYRSQLMHALARGARHLDRTADKAPAGVPRLAAWAGVLVAGLVLPGGDPRRAFGEAGLDRAIGASVFEDGGTVGRSPAGQVEAIQILTLVCESYAARRIEPPAFLIGAITRMVAALLGTCHGDRGLASWQGSGPTRGDVVQQVIEATGVRTRPLKQAREWGYQRLSAGSTVLIVDAAPPPIARVAAEGCASTLAFELSDGPSRIVVNCGGAAIADAQLPAELVHGLRTTAAHSTLVIGDSNSTAIHADGTLGRGVSEVELARQETDSASRIEAAHDGYARRFGFLHRRALTLSHDGRDLRGEDMLLPAGRRRSRDATPFTLRFHLAPHIEVSPTADGMAAILRTPTGILWQFRCKGGTLSSEESLWIDSRGRPQATQQLVVRSETPAGGTSVSWVFHRSK